MKPMWTSVRKTQSTCAEVREIFQVLLTASGTCYRTFSNMAVSSTNSSKRISKTGNFSRVGNQWRTFALVLTDFSTVSFFSQMPPCILNILWHTESTCPHCIYNTVCGAVHVCKPMCTYFPHASATDSSTHSYSHHSSRLLPWAGLLGSVFHLQDPCVLCG